MIDYIEFVKQYTFLKKSKLLFILAGGGTEFSKLLAIPGASNIISGISCCYDEDARWDVFEDLMDEPVSIVSREWVKWAFNMSILKNLVYEDNELPYSKRDIVIVSSAYPTIRERRGDNKAWIMMNSYVDPKLITFPKEVPTDRISADTLIHLRTKYERLVVKQVFSDLMV